MIKIQKSIDLEHDPILRQQKNSGEESNPESPFPIRTTEKLRKMLRALAARLRRRWKQVAHSAMLYGMLSSFVRIGANVILLPIILQRLSSAELAIWWVLLALGAVGNLADFGFGQAISRVYSFLWAGADDFDTTGLRNVPGMSEPNRVRLRQFNVTVRHLYWWLAGGATFLLAVGGSFVLRGAVKHANELPHLWLVWALYVISVGFSLGSSHWTLACQGVNRMRDLQAAYMWSGLTYVISAALLLVEGWGLFAMVAATALRAVVTRALSRKAYHRSVPVVVGEHWKREKTILKRLWPNAWKFGVLSVGVYLLNNGTVLICSHLLGEEVTASFGLTSQIALFAVGFSGLWLSVKWPQIIILRTQGRYEEMAVLFARRLALTLGTFVLLGALMALIGNRVLEWKGTHTRLLATPFLVVYLVYLGQQLMSGQFGNLTFTENVVLFYLLSLFTGVALVILGVIMTMTFGLWGLVVSPLIVLQLGAGWYPVWRGFRGQPLSIRHFLRAVIWGHV